MKVRKAVIAVAGRATRQYPASTAVQKAMFPLVDRDGVTKPVIQIIGEECVASGIEEICIVTAPGEDAVYRNYFRGMDEPERRHFAGKDWAMLESDRLEQFGRRLRFAVQATPEGFGHAVYQAREFVGDESFLLMLGDHVYLSDSVERCARQVMRVFEEEPGLVAVTGVQATMERELHLFGILRGRPIDEARGIYLAEKIVEKPKVEQARRELVTAGLPMGNYLGHFGIHVFSPAMMDVLGEMIAHNARDGGEIQLTTAQERVRAAGGKYWCALVRGQRFDTGIPYGLMETQLALGLHGVHRTEICEAIARILAQQVKQ